MTIDWHWQVTTDVDMGVDDVNMGFVLDLVYPDIHLVYNLTYMGIDSIWSPGRTLQIDFDSIENIFFQIFLFFLFFQISKLLLRVITAMPMPI